MLLMGLGNGMRKLPGHPCLETPLLLFPMCMCLMKICKKKKKKNPQKCQENQHKDLQWLVVVVVCEKMHACRQREKDSELI